MRKALALVIFAMTWPWPASAADPPGVAGSAEPVQDLRASIAALKSNPKGPFERIRWYCADGTVLPPEPFACREHGGGRQHGEWNATARSLRAAGFPVATVFAALETDDFAGEAWRRLLPFIVVEQYLVEADDGWIFRRGRYYRGAVQGEAEAASAERLLAHFTADPEWLDRRLPLLMEAARLFPAENAPASAGRVRSLATAINADDAGFTRLRNKLHNRLEPADAAAVRAYAADDPQGAASLEALAAAIDALFAAPDLEATLTRLAPPGPAGDPLRELVDGLAAASPAAELSRLAQAMAWLRAQLRDLPASRRLPALRAQLAMETRIFALGPHVLPDGASRAARLSMLVSLARAAYGTGLLTGFELSELEQAVASAGDDMPVAEWRELVGYLERVPGWAQRRLAFYFEPPLADFLRLEPRAAEFIPDRLRGSPLLAWSTEVGALATDAALLSGVRHQLMGREVAAGLRGLNPGLARGLLRRLEDLEAPGLAAGSIVIVPETVAELPPVAGILTANEGNVLSHVQLLARNLGVPNVVVGPDLMPLLEAARGEAVSVAVSPAGRVRIAMEGSLPAQELAPQDRQEIIVDPAQLDLADRRILPTTRLSPADSGVRVGPKAAQLGKLTERFPDKVSLGLAIPFGEFRAFLDQPHGAGGESMFAWMQSRYADLAAIADPATRAAAAAGLLAAIRAWIAEAPFPGGLRERLGEALAQHMGEDGSFGVFVRSDTNVEDLAGFTGAGLNLTVHNVVGFEAILEAIRAVWASPFTERAFGWRQALMNAPEHVYVSVLLHRSVNNDFSGVMITSDIATGDRGYLSVVANEGVGGGVEGQAAESLLIRRGDGELRLLSSATAPLKRVLLAAGGSTLVPASGRERLVGPPEVEQLRALARELPGWFDASGSGGGGDVVADVEYGFRDGQLMLFQIRPFVENRAAARSQVLQAMDAGLDGSVGRTVPLAEPPLGSVAELEPEPARRPGQVPGT